MYGNDSSSEGKSEAEAELIGFRYFLNILVDTTIGVGILWAILSGFQYVLIERLRLSGFQSGVYGDPPLRRQLKRWLKQLSVYITGLILMKLTVVALFHLCPWLSDVGRWVLEWTMGNYKLQVVFVMLMYALSKESERRCDF